jgi:hypothetical protein
MLKRREKKKTKIYLNCVILEEGMIKGRLVRDMHTINYVSIWALLEKCI